MAVENPRFSLDAYSCIIAMSETAPTSETARMEVLLTSLTSTQNADTKELRGQDGKIIYNCEYSQTITFDIEFMMPAAFLGSYAFDACDRIMWIDLQDAGMGSLFNTVFPNFVRPDAGSVSVRGAVDDFIVCSCKVTTVPSGVGGDRRPINRRIVDGQLTI